MPPYFSSSHLKQYLGEMVASARQAGFQTETISHHESIEIPAFSRLGAGNKPPVILLSAGIHGDEPAGLLTILEFLKSEPATEFTWLITPLLNPSGIIAGTRENMVGTDLNRAYGQCDSPEITSQLAWLANHPTPDLFIALHEDWEATGFYFYELHRGATPESELFCKSILAAVAPYLPIESGPLIDGHEATGSGWIYHEEIPEIPEIPEGLPEALYFINKGCAHSLTFETPSEAAIGERTAALLAAIHAAAKHFWELFGK